MKNAYMLEQLWNACSVALRALTDGMEGVQFGDRGDSELAKLRCEAKRMLREVLRKTIMFRSDEFIYTTQEMDPEKKYILSLPGGHLSPEQERREWFRLRKQFDEFGLENVIIVIDGEVEEINESRPEQKEQYCDSKPGEPDIKN